MKLHTGDVVVITTGKDKNKTGTIIRVMESENRVVVGGINIRTRHIKKSAQEAGRIIHYEAPIAVSNVMIIDPKTKKRSRIGYKIDEKGQKTRISKVSGEIVVKVKAAKTTTKKTGEKKEDVAAEAAAKTSKAPFWRKKGAPSDAAEMKEGSHSKVDKSVPDQLQTVHRSGGRGS